MDFEKTCERCSQTFLISAQDLSFYEKVSPRFDGEKILILPPTLCPDCRLQSRLAMRNERVLYRGTCGRCKKLMLSIYSPDKTIPVYCNACWWGDSWEALDYGREYDPDQGFFSQFTALWQQLPRLGLIQFSEMQNSDYTHDVLRLKNCYLVFDGEQAVDCLYGETFALIRDCVDFLKMQRSELCYECINCSDCYNLRYSRFCYHSSDSAFLLDCVACRNCFSCVNLCQRQYCFFNEQLEKDEYVRRVKEFASGSFAAVRQMHQRVAELFLKFPRRAYRGQRSENVSGDNLSSCKDSFDCYDSENLRDCRFCTNCLMGAADCYDLDIWGNDTQLVYNSAMSGEGAHSVIGGYYCCYGVSRVFYSAFCTHNCHNLFGCVGLRQKQYCILNKQYSAEDFERIAKQIAARLRSIERWGEYFPESFSDFGYNETVANEFYPLKREPALALGFRWSDYENPDPQAVQIWDAAELPDGIGEADERFLNGAVRCEISNRVFRITRAEFEYYQRHSIPLPRRHPDERHRDRLSLRPRRKLWTRTCPSCSERMQTSYSPGEPEQVLCERCYQKLVFE